MCFVSVRIGRLDFRWRLFEGKKSAELVIFFVKLLRIVVGEEVAVAAVLSVIFYFIHYKN